MPTDEQQDSAAEAFYGVDVEHAAGRELARQLVRMESKNHALEMLLKQALTLATEATNGWACYAKRRAEHDEIARLH